MATRAVAIARPAPVAPVAQATPRPSARGKGGAAGSGWKTVLAAIAGGAGGALVGGVMVRAGVKPTTAAVMVTTAGAVGAAATKGPLRAAAFGCAAAGAGQLALGWLANREAKKEEEAVKQQEQQAAAQPSQPAAVPAANDNRPRQGMPNGRSAFARNADDDMEEFD